MLTNASLPMRKLMYPSPPLRISREVETEDPPGEGKFKQPEGETQTISLKDLWSKAKQGGDVESMRDTTPLVRLLKTPKWNQHT